MTTGRSTPSRVVLERSEQEMALLSKPDPNMSDSDALRLYAANKQKFEVCAVRVHTRRIDEMGMPISVTVSSVGVSRSIALDWMTGEDVAVAVTGSSSGSFAYTIQYTLDDLQRVTSPSWINDPNATALTANSSGAFLYQLPVAGIRLNSSALSSAVLTMKVMQGVN